MLHRSNNRAPADRSLPYARVVGTLVPNGPHVLQAWRCRQLMVALLVVTCFRCAPEAPDEKIGFSAGAVAVASSEPGPAAGPVVAVRVTPSGDIVCTKSDGGPWSSAKGGHVEFWLGHSGGSWTFAGYREYDPQPPNGYLMEITLPAAESEILDLPVGTDYRARCIAMPYIDIPDWSRCTNYVTGEANLPCTTSGDYEFDIVAGGPEDQPGYEDRKNCGEGEGAGKGQVLCVANRQRPKGDYRYDFQCTSGATYEVKLTTSGKTSNTTLTVHDTEGALYGYSKETGSVDRITFKAASTYNQCFAVVQAETDSKFKLQVRPGNAADAANGLIQGHRWTAIIDAGHGKDPSIITPGYGCNDTLDPTLVSGNMDDEMASTEHQYNKMVTAAIGGLVNDFYEIIDYDATVKPWAANYEKVTQLEILRRETELSYGCDGYRGYVMRLWTRQNGRDPTRTVVMQIHNDNYGCVGPFCEPLGSEAYFEYVLSGDSEWLAAARAAMTSNQQTWRGEKSLTESHASIARAVRGYTTLCNNALLPEKNCAATNDNKSTYGAILNSGLLLEVAHYTLDDLRYEAEDAYASDAAFIQSVGLSLRVEIEDYFWDKL